MKYKFYGKEIPYKGKTLWEIVANLKNFGIGRMVVNDSFVQYPEPSYMKILKVQPVQAPTAEFEDRKVLLWVERVHRGLKYPGACEIVKFTDIAQYHLIPKIEEEDYIRRAEEYEKNFKVTQVPKYIHTPPTFKEIWKSNSVPKINTIIQQSLTTKISTEETVKAPTESSFQKLEGPFEEQLKKLVRLQKIVNSYKNI